MCNTSDVGTECAHPADKRYYPVRLLIFDRCPGGMGVSAQVFEVQIKIIFKLETLRNLN